MSARRRYFTIDEALAQLLDEEEDFLFGTAAEVDSGSSSQDADGDDGVSTASDDPQGDGLTDDGADHFLDREVDTSAAAQRFTPGVSDEGEPSGESRCEQGDLGNRVTGRECGCSQCCLKAFDAAEIEQAQLTMMELDRQEKELIVLGLLESARYGAETTHGKKRRRARFSYSFQGVKICVGAFRFIYSIGQKQMKNLLKHSEENGPVPRVHGNKGRKPKHALDFATVENVVKFIKSHATVFGIPHPAPLRGRDDTPPIFLPASQHYKSVHKIYVESCEAAQKRAVGYDAFRSIWHQCIPEVKFMTPRTDVCDKCETLRRGISSAVTEAQKLAASEAFLSHLHAAQRERENYIQKTKDAKEEMDQLGAIEPPPNPPCSTNLRKVHYTFDFAQNVSLPYSARQVGPVYFKTPRKVQIFGVNSEAVPKQINYLIDEAETIGPNGKNSHGANSVISMLHHFFERHGHGEKECVCHADNCCGQNKNKTVMAYFAWRVMCGLHEKVTLSFMIAGHTQCLIDGCFGLLQQKFRRSNCFTLQQLEEVVQSSASCNVAQLLAGSGMSWRAWDVFLQLHFRQIKNIRRYQHFEFNADKPGVVTVRESIVDAGKEVQILKTAKEDVLAAGLAEVIPPAGLTPDRVLYLHKQIRPHMPPAFQDDLCPPPLPEPEAHVQGAAEAMAIADDDHAMDGQ